MSKIMKYQSKVARIQNDVTVYLIIKKKEKEIHILLEQNLFYTFVKMQPGNVGYLCC